MLHLTKEFNDVNERSQEIARLALIAAQSAFKDDALTIEKNYQSLLKGYSELQGAMRDLRAQVNKYRTPKPVDYERYEY